jgi:HNH endonuclease
MWQRNHVSTFDEKYNLLSDGRRIWMIQADETIWHWDEILDDKPYRCDWGGDKWVKSNASRHRILEELKAGDIAFCYQAAPDKKVLGVARFSKGRNQRTWGPVEDRGLIFWLNWWRRVPPLPYDVIKGDNILADSEKVKVGQGTLFRVSPGEAKRLLSLIGVSSFDLPIITRELRLPHKLVPRTVRQNICVDLVGPPKKVKTEITRIIRDTAMTSGVKHANGFRCIVCGERLVRSDGYPYAEAHHLQPLGGEHRGPDVKANIVVLCPNHHAEFDFGAIAINPLSGTIDHIDRKNKWQGKYPRGETNTIGKWYIEYHFTHRFGQKGG